MAKLPMPHYFLLEGHHEIHRLTEIDRKAHVTTAEGTFKVREKIYSNTFIVEPGYTPISHIYEAVPVDLEAVAKTIPESSLHAPSFYDLSSILSQKEVSEMVQKYHLLRKDETLDPSAPSMGLVARIRADNVIKVLCYMQALDGSEEFALYDENVKKWAYANFQGTSVEIGLYVLLHSIEHCRTDEFMAEWRRRDLNEPDMGPLLFYMKRSALAAMRKADIGKLLVELNIPHSW